MIFKVGQQWKTKMGYRAVILSLGDAYGAVWFDSGCNKYGTIRLDFVNGCFDDAAYDLESLWVAERTEPPESLRGKHLHHWLWDERSSMPSMAEWLNNSWRCVGEVEPVTPEDMFRRGWRYKQVAQYP